MAAIKQPLLDIVYNDETGRYIGMLERKVVKYQLDDIRFRALLELLTDEPWDDYQFTEEDGEIQKIAVDALKRRLGIPEQDARKLVAERWARHNPDPAESEEARTYLIGKTPTPHVVTQARPMKGATPQPGYDVAKHLAGIAQARERHEETAMQREVT